MNEEEFASMIENTPTDKFAGLFPATDPAMNIKTIETFKNDKGYTGYTAKVTYNDGTVAYPTLWCKSEKQVYMVVLDWAIEIYEQATDEENNYGLLFYYCGYNGKRQTEVKQQCERRGVTII